MKRIALLCLMALAAPALGQAPKGVASLSAVATPTTGTAVRTDGVRTVQVEIISSSSTASTTLIEQSMNCSTYVTVATETNANSAGTLWMGPPAACTRTRVSSYTSGGTISSWIATTNAPLTGYWHRSGNLRGTATPTPYPTPTPTPTATPTRTPTPTPTATPTP